MKKRIYLVLETEADEDDKSIRSDIEQELGMATHYFETISYSENSFPDKWISVNDSQPKKDGIYFAVYKFLNLNDCVSTREFRDGKWIEEVGREEVRFWMPIPKLQKEV